MLRVFISYRRACVPFEAAILHATLAQKFGKTRVFLDTATIPGGTDLNPDVEHIARIIDPFPRKRRIIIAALLGLATLAAWMWMTREDMVTVGAGPFVMGCNRAVDDECGSNEQDAHTVDVPRFRID